MGVDEKVGVGKKKNENQSGLLDVVTSMYEKEHPFNKNAFKKSTSKKEYNFNAKMFPTLGIAMQDYDSEEVGTIKVVLGK